MSEITQIPVTKETRELLKKAGTKGETYDIIIRRLLANMEEKESE